MGYIILFLNHQGSLKSIQIVRDITELNIPMLFDEKQEAIDWADEFLGDMPYQVINADHFQSTSERPTNY